MSLLRLDGLWLPVLLCLLMLQPTVGQERNSFDQPKVTPAECPPTHHFQISSLDCRPCLRPNTQQHPTDPTTCACKPGFKKKVTYGEAALECEACPDGSGPTPDGWACIQCNKLPGSAACESCGTAQLQYVRTVFGALEQEQMCQTCRAATHPVRLSTTGTSGAQFCAPCTRFSDQETNCDCESAADSEWVRSGGVCFTARPDVARVQEQVDRSIAPKTGAAAASLMLETYQRAAEVLCMKGNVTACNFLANMCALLHFTDANGNACDSMSNIYASGAIAQQYLPRLTSKEARAELSRTTLPVQYTFNTESVNHRLRIVAAVYDVRGRFMGYENADSGFLQLCPAPTEHIRAGFVFGQQYDLACEIATEDLWAMYETKFYDLKLEYEREEMGGAGPRQHYRVPVLNREYKDGSSQPNKGERMDDWFLAYRMFVVDNVAAVEQTGEPAKFVRYASRIQLLVTVQETKDGHILPPYLIVDYDDVPLAKRRPNATVSVRFSVRYVGSTQIGNRHDKDLEITMGVLCSLGLLWSLLCAWSWGRRAGKYMIDLSTVFQFLLYLAGNLSDVFFVVMLSTAIYICMAYKMQLTVVYVVLSPSQERPALVCVVIAFVLKLVQLIHNRVEQMLTETFFIDWERPRGNSLPESGHPAEQAPSIQDANNRPSTPVTVWRTYMLANEWNELQSYRKTSVPIQMMALIFCLYILNMRAIAVVEPGFQLAQAIPPYVGDSVLNRIGLLGGLYLLIGFIQWAFNVIVYEKMLEDHFLNFMDLCSISNVSVLALTRAQFGYYIHGRSVHGHSDADMKEMNMMLQRERDNLTGHRGLEPNSELQTFLVCLPNSFRQKVNAIREQLRSGSLNTRDTNVDISTAKMNVVIQVHENMNNYLSAFVEQRTLDGSYTIKDRSAAEALLDVEFEDTSQTGIFYRDPSETSYTRAFLYGNEWINLSFDCLLLIVLDMATGDYILAIILAYIITQLLMYISQKGFTSNLVKSSLVDYRFLI